MKRYFVSYVQKESGRDFGYGNCELRTGDTLVLSKLARQIEEQNKFPDKSVVVLYYKLMNNEEMFNE